MEAREITVRPYGSGQKSKARTVAFYRRTQQVLWLYIQDAELCNSDSLFEMTTSGIRTMLWRLGNRSGIENVHPHRFRHTFAIMFLQNGGDIYSPW